MVISNIRTSWGFFHCCYALSVICAPKGKAIYSFPLEAFFASELLRWHSQMCLSIFWHLKRIPNKRRNAHMIGLTPNLMANCPSTGNNGNSVSQWPQVSEDWIITETYSHSGIFYWSINSMTFLSYSLWDEQPILIANCLIKSWHHHNFPIVSVLNLKGLWRKEVSLFFEIP